MKIKLMMRYDFFNKSLQYEIIELNYNFFEKFKQKFKKDLINSVKTKKIINRYSMTYIKIFEINNYDMIFKTKWLENQIVSDVSILFEDDYIKNIKNDLIRFIIEHLEEKNKLKILENFI
jgi:hypothetical protein